MDTNLEKFKELYVKEALKVADLWESARASFEVCLRVDGEEIVFNNPQWRFCVLREPYKGTTVMWSHDRDVLEEAIQKILDETDNLYQCMQFLSINPTYNSDLVLDYILGIQMEFF